MSQQPAPQRLRPFKPLRFGRYTLLRPISTGGMGEIFLARLEGAHGFDKLCVIKKILPHLAEDHDFVERFVDEARILVKLSHGHVAQVLDMGVHEGAPFIALEFIDGKDLRRVLGRMRDRQLPIPFSFVVYVMSRVLDALAYAHRKRGDDDQELNLVHRDVSPQNVLISYEGEVKVIDFGLAKSTLSSSKTNPSIIMGKFRYMSPEQARHQKVDRRSDLYAVGLCLYELISGHNPFDDVPPGELMAQVANPQVRPLDEVEPLCPPALAEVVARALAPDPADRFQTAEQFRARLASLLLEIDPSAGPETAARFMREAFAIEHHAERKMLAALREQTRGLGDASLEPQEDDAEPPSREPRELPPVSDETPVPDSLSFLPTRKGAAGPIPKRGDDERERETLPAVAGDEALAPTLTRHRARPYDHEAAATNVSVPIVAAPEPPPSLSDALEPTLARHPAWRSDDDAPVNGSVPVVGAPEPPRAVGDALAAPLTRHPVRLYDDEAAVTNVSVPVVSAPDLPSVVVDDLEALAAEAPARTREPERKPRPAARPGDALRVKPKPRPAHAKAKRPAPRPTRSEPPKRVPARAAVTPPVAQQRPRRVLVWLVLPLLALLAVAGYITWDLYAQELDALRQEQARQHKAPRERPAGDLEVAPEPEEPNPASVAQQLEDAGLTGP
jgi:serine/threonine protein kinase